MERKWTISEEIEIDVRDDVLFSQLVDLRNMKRWSPECVGVIARRYPLQFGDKFVGFNRRGLTLWFTIGKVSSMLPSQSFAFEVSVFGLPIASWSYEIVSLGPERCLIRERWTDRRVGRGSTISELLGLFFTGVSAPKRHVVNVTNIASTLSAMKKDLESRF
ncbi:SRPBCC family protein [Streptomyces cinereoruber]|uniref:SRPBCC family protein n=1 Tax=Streptomyces cinereoruber TaxID=67260 RepID=UPI0036273468